MEVSAGFRLLATRRICDGSQQHIDIGRSGNGQGQRPPRRTTVVCVIETPLSGGLIRSSQPCGAPQVRSHRCPERQRDVDLNERRITVFVSQSRLILEWSDQGDIEYLIKRIPLGTTIGRDRQTQGRSVSRRPGDIRGTRFRMSVRSTHDISATCRALSDARRKGNPVWSML